MYIYNLLLKNRSLNTSFGQFSFDNKGKAEVSEEVAEKLLALKGYRTDTSGNGSNGQGDNKNSQTGITPPPEEKQPESSNTAAEIENSDMPFTLEDLEAKNPPQLKKIAKEYNIDLAGASKKNEIIPIILGSFSK